MKVFKNFKKKDEELNIVNFGCGSWGNDIVYDRNITKNIIEVHGWHFGKILYHGTNKLKKGSLVIKGTKDGYWYGRILKIEWCNDPRDMFFAKVKTINKSKMLRKNEIKYLEDNNLINYCNE